MLLVLEDCKKELRADVLAAKGETEDASERTPSETEYITPYIDLMLQAIEEFEISSDNQPIKESLVEWFLAQEISGQKVSRATAGYLASFVRLPESRSGGNRPWKVKAQKETGASK